MDYDLENEENYEEYDFKPKNNFNFNNIILLIGKILSYATLICAVLMIIYLILQHIGANDISHKPASFFTNAIAQYFINSSNFKSDDPQLYYFLFQWGTALVMLAIGTRVANNLNVGAILGIYCITAIYIPTIFIPIQILGAIMAVYLCWFIGLNCLVMLGLGKFIGIHSYPGFPGLKKFLFSQK